MKISFLMLINFQKKKKNSVAEQIKKEIESGKFVEATESWSYLEDVISSSSNSVVN